MSLTTVNAINNSVQYLIHEVVIIHCDRDERRHCTFQCNVNQVG